FFQAEDGIRDFHVTGLQTCARPISLIAQKSRTPHQRDPARWLPVLAAIPVVDILADLVLGPAITLLQLAFELLAIAVDLGQIVRSAERRVGEGCRTWSPPTQ